MVSVSVSVIVVLVLSPSVVLSVLGTVGNNPPISFNMDELVVVVFAFFVSVVVVVSDVVVSDVVVADVVADVVVMSLLV